MKDVFYKYVPIVVGVALGILAVSPPQFFGLPPLVRILIAVPAVALAFLAFSVFMISAALPADVKMTPIDPKLVTNQMMDVFLGYQDLGFQLAGPPLRIETSPAAILVPLVDPSGQVYGTIYRTGTEPPKTACDLVTLFESPRAGLTTGSAVEGASLPAASGSFYQVFPGADLRELYSRHMEAVEQLKSRGLRVKPASAATFVQDFRDAVNHQRRHFLSNPLWHAFVVIYRSATSTTPHLGPVAQQTVAQQTLRNLRERLHG